MPACQEGQRIRRQTRPPGLRLLPSDLLLPVTWPTRPPLHTIPRPYNPKGKDGRFGKEGGARQRHGLRKTGHSPFHGPFSPVFFNPSLSPASFPVEHTCARVRFFVKFLPCVPATLSERVALLCPACVRSSHFCLLWFLVPPLCQNYVH